MTRRRAGSVLMTAMLLANLGIAMPAAVQPVLAASTWYVGPGGGGSAPCDTPNFTTGDYADDAAAIQVAVDDPATADGDTIHLCADTYALPAAIFVGKNLTFEGDSSTATTLDGGGLNALFRSTAPASSITVRDMTLQNGVPAILATQDVTVSRVVFSGNRADTATALDRGGAIASYGNATVSDSLFVGNTAASAGGAIASAGAVDVNDSVFRENSAGSGAGVNAGGAIFGTYSVTVSGSLFEDNTAGTDSDAGAGGAIYAYSDLTVADSAFRRNAAAAYGSGGALRGYTGSVTVTGSDFSANTAGFRGGAIAGEHAVTVTGGSFDDNAAGNDAYRGYGGAIHSNDHLTAVTVHGVSFERNLATGDGGAVDSYGTVNASSSYFGDNSAATDNGNGGAIYAEAWGDPAFAVRTWNSTFSGNRANQGGAVYGNYSGVFARNVTFAGNTFGAASGGAISTTNGIHDVGNSIFAAATDTCGGPINDRGGNIAVTDGSASGCIDAGTSREIASAALLDLGAPALNAPGTTKTMALGPTSIAIGYAVRSLCNDAATVNHVDQRGASRDQWTGCDSGAYQGAAGPGAYVVGTGTQDCTAYHSIQEAVDATTGGTIHVCGTHELTGGVWVQYDATFEGDSTTSTVVDGGGLYRLFMGNDGAAWTNLIFRDMTLRNGFSGNFAPGLDAAGGAILAGRIDAERVLFSGNRTSRPGLRSQGGAIYARQGSGHPEQGYVSLTDSTFVDNETGWYGGAVYAEQVVTIDGGRFARNHAAEGTNGFGGAILADYGVIADGVEFADNGARAGGGAIKAWDGVVTISDSRFHDNTTGADGAAIEAAAEVAILRTDFTLNNAGNGNGGAIKVTGSQTATIVGSTFDQNVAGLNGAAVLTSAPAHVTNSTFAMNTTAGASGAIHATGSLLDVRNVTFLNNSGDLGDGAIVSTATATTVANTVFGSAMDECSISALSDLGGNIDVSVVSSGCIDGAQTRSKLATAAQLDLGALAANGGPTRTVAITDGSAAYGYARGTTDGTSAGALICTESADAWSVASIDQRGYPRPRGAGCDSGAVEASPQLAVYIVGRTYDPGTGAAPASCSNAPYTTIQDAVDAAVDTDTVHVCEGTYDLTTAVYIRPDLTTLTFAGDGTSGSATATIVRSDPGATTRLFTTDNYDSVAETLYHHAISFEGMTFRGGRGYNDYARPAPTGSAAGGAIWVSGDVTLDHTEFVGNSANQYGGAVYARWGVAITSSTFTDNTTGLTGGAIAACDGSVSIGGPSVTACDSTTSTIVDSIFTGNTSTLDGGGAVYVEGNSGSSSQLVVTGSHFIANLASGGTTAYGGAIRADYADVSVVGGTFTENVAGIAGTSNDGYGGAIAGRQDVRITGGTVFSGNFANNYGAGAVYADGDIESTGGSYLANFTSEYAGGGALYAAGTVFSDHDTFTGNTSGFGGAVYTDRAIVVRGSTFTDNESVYYEGGAIYVYCYSDCVPTELSGGTFTGNVAAADGGAIYVYCDWADCQPSSSGSTYTGNSTAVDSSAYGGAIWSNAGLRSRFDTFTGNTADGAGGAVYAYESVDSSAATYVGNSSRNSEGGALWVDEVLTSVGDTFSDNTTGNSYGGAIYGSGNAPVDGISFAITDGTFIRNVADQEGGAIYLNGSIDVSGGTFERNDSGWDGGAIYVTASATVRGADFSANSSWRHGGAVYAYYDVTIDGGTYSENRTAYDGDGGAVHAGEWIHASDALFSGNRAGGPGRSRYGGAIYACSSGSSDECSSTPGFGFAVALERVEFSANTASEGGAVYVGSVGSLGSTDGTYTRNLATLNNGGAVYVDSGDVVSRTDTFTDNSAGSGGGAIYASTGSVDSSGGTYEDNTAATNPGGAVYANDRFVSLGDTFRRNSAGTYGGAVYGGGETAITDGTFADNTAGDSPYSTGGAVFSSGAVTIERSTFARNTAPALPTMVGDEGAGGAVYTYDRLSALNSTFVGNAAYTGGALYAAHGVTTRFVTFVDNTATTGGTLAATDLTDGNLDATATIFLGGDCSIDGATTADDDNLAAESDCSATTTTRALLDLAPLALNAPGTTETVAITDGSSAYNHVTSPNCTVSEDQRGFHRPQGGACDAGAFEVAAVTPAGAYIVDDMVNLGTNTCADYATIAAAVALASAGDTIHVCGTHDLTATVNVDKILSFEGDSSTDTIVDGGDAVRLFVGTSLAFSDMTLRHGAATSGDAIEPNGGAILGGSIDIVRVRFLDNSAATNGGAVYARGDVSITDATFVGNDAGDYGGALMIQYPFADRSLTVTRSTFTDNHALGGGGAITVNADHLAIHVAGSTFGDNSAGTDAGAIGAYSESSDPGASVIDVTSSTFIGNRAGTKVGAATGRGGAITNGGSAPGSVVTSSRTRYEDGEGTYGGAIWNAGPVTSSDDTFSGNDAIDGAGGAIWALALLTVTGSDFTANTATTFGGALYGYGRVIASGATFDANEATQEGGAVTADAGLDSADSVYTDNTSATGGAVNAPDDSTSLGDTFERNHATGDGGALYVKGIVTISDGTFADNTAIGDGGAVFGSVFVSITDGTFDRNSGDEGGAVCATKDGIGVQGTHFTDNTAATAGGAIWSDGSAGISGALFLRNSTTSSESNGGAVFVAYGRIDISGGSYTANEADGNGGAIFAAPEVPIDISGAATFVDNTAGAYGGAIDADANTGTGDATAGDVAVTDGTFLRNVAGTDGGAIHVGQRGSLRVDGGSFEGNVGGYGGALRVKGDATLDGASFIGNIGNAGGGGAIYGNCHLVVRGGSFTGNGATDSYGKGGAIFGESGADSCTRTDGPGDLLLEIDDADFTANTAGERGGAVFSQASVAVTDGTFAGNSSRFGGAIAADSDVTIRRDTFAGNSATSGDGGAIFASGAVAVTDGTFTDNTAGTPSCADSCDGGAIYAEGAVSIRSSLGRTAFRRNLAEGGDGGAVRGADISVVVADFSSNTSLEDVAVVYGGYGGALSATGTVSVTDATFTSNQSGYQGGAIYGGTTVAIHRADFTANTSRFEGGAVYGNGDVSVRTATFTRSGLASEFEGYGGAIYGHARVAVTDGTFTDNTAGQNDDESTYYDGGAIAALTGVSIDGGTFTGNRANYGGAISTETYEAPVEISGATFIDNDATIQGGAIWSYGDATIVGGTFTGNRSGEGGAVYSYLDVTSDPSIYQDNTASFGGAIYAEGDVTTTDDTFERNSATSGDGGAVYAGGSLDVTRGRFLDNSAATGEDGGAIYAGGDLGVRGSTFARNHAGASGSAVVFNGAAGTIVNSTFVDNTAGVGGSGNGAVYAGGGSTLDVRNVTFVGNRGSGAAGAILGDTVSVANSIFGSASDECQISSITDLGGNLDVTLAPTSACLDTINQPLSKTVATAAELGLGTLALNAPGSTETISISDGSAAIGYGLGTLDGTAEGDLVCLDTTDPLSVGGRDQRGVSRTSGDQTGSACDSGAYENTTGIRLERVPVPAIVATQVSRATATNVDPFWDTATVSGTSGDGSGGFVDPTGEVQFFVCYDVASAANCDWATETGTWDPLGDPIDLSAGSSATDGIAATVASDPVTGPDGWYVFHASYSSGDTDIYLDAEDSGGTSERVRVAPVSIVLSYNGPVVVYTTTTTPNSAQVALTASVSPNTHACPVTFSVDPSAGVSPAGPYTAWTGGSGTATTSPITFPTGVYSVTVSTSGPCAGAPDFTGILSVVEQTGAAGKGGTGGGFYKLNPPGPPKVSLGYTVKVTSVTSKVGRTTVTTTSTKGNIIWTSKSGWRLKGTVDYSSTDGSTAWSVRSCDPGNPWGTLPATAKCGSFSGSGVLQRYDGTAWVTSSYGRVNFVAMTYDGGQVSVCKGTGKLKTCSLSDLTDYFGITMTASVNGILTQVRYVDSTYPPVNTNSGGGAIAPFLLQQGAIKVY